jgi:hypothetical protein
MDGPCDMYIRTREFFRWECSIKCWLKKLVILVRNWFNWLRRGINDRFMWTYEFHKILEIPWIAKRLVVSQELHEEMNSICSYVFHRRVIAMTTLRVTFYDKMTCVLSLQLWYMLFAVWLAHHIETTASGELEIIQRFGRQWFLCDAEMVPEITQPQIQTLISWQCRPLTPSLPTTSPNCTVAATR